VALSYPVERTPVPGGRGIVNLLSDCGDHEVVRQGQVVLFLTIIQ
jgi:hypothetical protein